MSNTPHFRLPTVQVLMSHMWPVAAVLDSEGVERVWAGEVRLTLGMWWASRPLEGHKCIVLAEQRTTPACKEPAR